MFYTLKTTLKMPVIVAYEDRAEHYKTVTEWEDSNDTKNEMLRLVHHQCAQVTAVDADTLRVQAPYKLPDKHPLLRLGFVANYPGNRQVFMVSCPVTVGGGDFLSDVDAIELWDKLHPASRIQIVYGIEKLAEKRLKEAVKTHNETYDSRSGETPVDLTFVGGDSKLTYVAEGEWCKACDVLLARMAKKKKKPRKAKVGV